MTNIPADVTQLLRDLLGDIAPDADTATLAVDAHIRDTLDIDSVDFLNFVTAIYQRTGVDIPEQDYRQVSTLGDCASYVSLALASR